MRSRGRRKGWWHYHLESLEGRQLLSSAPTSAAAGGLKAPIAQWAAPAMAAPATLVGMPIFAQAGQSFQCVVGWARLPVLPSIYTLKGIINWGDGSATSDALILYTPNDSVVVLGKHTYDAPGTDVITVQLMAVPPAGSLAPVRLLGIIKSKAMVFAPNGRLTLNATINTALTSNVGFFRTTVPANQLTAIINWGDGKQSVGKILELPTAGPVAGGSYVVVGEHTYTALGSYHVHVSVISSSATPVASTAVLLVAAFDSVVDVLPALPTTADVTV